jgi:hypothetical protein
MSQYEGRRQCLHYVMPNINEIHINLGHVYIVLFPSCKLQVNLAKRKRVKIYFGDHYLFSL